MWFERLIDYCINRGSTKHRVVRIFQFLQNKNILHSQNFYLLSKSTSDLNIFRFQKYLRWSFWLAARNLSIISENIFFYWPIPTKKVVCCTSVCQSRYNFDETKFNHIALFDNILFWMDFNILCWAWDNSKTGNLQLDLVKFLIICHCEQMTWATTWLELETLN